jgi:kumamolisin
VDGTSINCSEPSCDDTEQTLDITQAGGMAPGVTTIYMYVGSSDTALLSGMSSDTPLPLNLSSSWYWGANPSGDDPYFEKMAAQGQTYFEASGDSGGYTEDSPWPMNSQYVNTVGGTSLTTSGPGGAWSSETYWSYRGTSYGGGGWGTNVELPSWQVQAATTCANEGGECSTTYRDVPDEAANAQFSFYVCADQKACTENEYGGTSFASPMWAGYIALANEQAVTNGSPAPGFLNPTIYPLNLGNGDADFHDITANGGASTFPCVAGYNMCAGWGSPNGDALINALTGPAGPNFTLSASPNSVTVQQGTSGTSTITITPEDGFSGSVTLSASGLPNGVTAQFSPNPATTTSTLTLTASASAATGTVTVTIQGVSGSLTNSTTLSLTVTPSGPVVSLNPTSINFGKKLVGSTSAGKKIILTNTGGSPLSITSIATSAPFALKAVKQTKKVTPCVNGGTVAVGATCEIEVTFSPTAVQSYTGDVTFTDNANPTTQQVSLSGTGKE